MANRYNRVGWLLVPAGNEKMVRSGVDTEADVLVPDLEDATSYPGKAKQDAEKEKARELLVDILGEEPIEGQEFIPRINTLDSEYWEDDVEALAPAKPDGFLIPKVQSANRVQRLSDTISDLEREHGFEQESITLSCMIETPYSLLNLYELASSDRRIDALVFGPGDFSLHLGALRDDEKRLETIHSIFDPVRIKLATVASELGIDAIGGPPSLYSLLASGGYTPEGYEYEHSNRSARMGFDGKIVLHPSHLTPVRKGFAPSEAEVEKAKQLTEFREQAQEEGRRKVKMRNDGEIFLPAFITQAEETIARYKQLGSREEIANQRA